MTTYDPASTDPCERLMAELHAALKEAHVDEHLRPRAVLRVTKAYEAYWAALERPERVKQSAAATALAERPTMNIILRALAALLHASYLADAEPDILDGWRAMVGAAKEEARKLVADKMTWYEQGWAAGVETCAVEVEHRPGLPALAKHLRGTCNLSRPGHQVSVAGGPK